MRVLSWNLFHGRSVPDTPHALRAEFAERLASWEWDVALLQEVPPWWPALLAPACGADARMVLTSRNALLALRRAIAERRPDLIKSNGGGANAILVRPGAGAVAVHARRRLRFRPERRVLHAVRLVGGAGGPLWVANVHATANPKPLARVDMARCGETLARWAGPEPVLLGGDANVADPDVPGFTDAGGHRIDRFFLRGGWTVATPPRTLDAGPLSDHRPVAIEVVV
jgi:endonuclease/exonuclease/phosphatase family metal-dependent hydrolase